MAGTAQLNWVHVSSLNMSIVRFPRKFLSILKKSITDLECISGNTDINYVQEMQTLTMSN